MTQRFMSLREFLRGGYLTIQPGQSVDVLRNSQVFLNVRRSELSGNGAKMPEIIARMAENDRKRR